MKRTMRAFYVVVLLACLTGCAKQVKDDITPEQLRTKWLSEQQVLANISHWKIKGRSAVKTADDSGTVSLFWEQKPDEYTLRIVAPFGQGTLLLEGSEQGVQLTDSQGEVLKAATAKGLIWMRTGWAIPVESLKVWMLGRVLDQNNATLSVNSDATIQSFEKDGWYVEYQSYQTVQHQGRMIELPKKILLKSKHLQIKLKVSKWELF